MGNRNAVGEGEDGAADLLDNVPVFFQVPRGKARPSDEENSKDRIVRRLSIEFPVSGMKGLLPANGKIPVFDQGEDLPSPVAGEGVLASEKLRPIQDVLRRAGGGACGIFGRVRDRGRIGGVGWANDGDQNRVWGVRGIVDGVDSGASLAPQYLASDARGSVSDSINVERDEAVAGKTI